MGAINGFGRIGRQVARIAMKDPETELKLVNASYDAEYLAYQMKYDSIHGRYDGTVEVDGDSLVIDGHRVALSHTRDPAEIPFTEHGAEYVCESTGVFLTDEKIQPHLKAGAKKVVFSAPAKDDSHTIVMGVNQDTYKTDMAFRVPTIDVSVVDLTCELEKETTYEAICAEIKRRSEGDMKGFLGYCDEALVSTDFETCPISSTFDAKAGIMLDPTFVKLVA